MFLEAVKKNRSSMRRRSSSAIRSAWGRVLRSGGVREKAMTTSTREMIRALISRVLGRGVRARSPGVWLMYRYNRGRQSTAGT